MSDNVTLKDWARYFDEDYDVDMDAAPGPFIAAQVYSINPHSACLALLNISTRSQKREKYDEVMKWLLELPDGLKAMEMERLWEKQKKS